MRLDSIAGRNEMIRDSFDWFSAYPMQEKADRISTFIQGTIEMIEEESSVTVEEYRELKLLAMDWARRRPLDSEAQKCWQNMSIIDEVSLNQFRELRNIIL